MKISNPSDERLRDILQNTRRIAVVGMSNNSSRTSYQVARAMSACGYEIIPVNPTVNEIEGTPCYSSLKEIPGKVDLVNVFRRSEHLPGIMAETTAIEAPVFWAQLGLESEEAYAAGRAHGLQVIMNRCILIEYRRLMP